MKKNNALISLFFITIACNIHAMEEPSIKIQDQTTFADYMDSIAAILLGNEQFKKDDSFLWQHLSPEIKNIIVSFLLEYNEINSLEQVGKIISSLAMVNKELNQLINNSEFCLKLIKHLSQKFNCSNEVVANQLQTQEAQKRLLIQKTIEQLIAKEYFDEQQFDQFYNEHKDYIDLNFTYKSDDNLDWKQNLLLIAVQHIDINGNAKIRWLLNTKKSDINYANKFGITILMDCALKAKPATVKILCNYPDIKIDQKKSNNETALMNLCHFINTPLFNIENMKILINAGANPEITNNKGCTLLEIVKKNENEEAIQLIEDAIDKKHRK